MFGMPLRSYFSLLAVTWPARFRRVCPAYRAKKAKSSGVCTCLMAEKEIFP